MNVDISVQFLAFQERANETKIENIPWKNGKIFTKKRNTITVIYPLQLEESAGTGVYLVSTSIYYVPYDSYLINLVAGRQRGVLSDWWKEGKYCSLLLVSSL